MIKNYCSRRPEKYFSKRIMHELLLEFVKINRKICPPYTSKFALYPTFDFLAMTLLVKKTSTGC